MTRDRHEREQDRADLLAALEEADRSGEGPAHGLTDLRALERAGLVVTASHWSNWRTYALATDEAVDAESDRAEVERMAAQWEPIEEPAS